MKSNFTRSLIVFVVLFVSGLSITYAQVGLTSLGSTYSQDFNTLASIGTTNDVSTLPAGWTFLETGTSANTTYAAGTGSSNTGNTYSLGVDSDRALGELRSGACIPVLGASFVNNTGAVVTSLQISYAGEQWRLGAASRPFGDQLDFQYSLTATSLATGAWVDVNDLDFTAPVIAGTAGALIGNNNRTVRTATIDGLSIAPGSVFWIRWNDLDVSGSDDALGVDDFSIVANGIPGNQPNISFTPSSLNFGIVNTGSRRTLTYIFDGSNLDNATTILKEYSSSFSISLDGVSFTDSLAVNDSTVVYVRFTPLADGPVADSIDHVNGSFHKALSISGVGYDPVANIIPIATARTKPVGTRVTVAGRVTVSNQFASPSYVQDETGGMPVFDSNVSNNIAIGDSIIVTGPIGAFNLQVQISGPGISFIKPDSSSRIIAPKNIQLNEMAANEGLLVTVQDVDVVNKSFVFYPQSTEQMTNGSATGDLRIDGDTNIPGLTKPQATVDITGVVGRFQTNAQLMPRSKQDIPGAEVPEVPGDSIPKTSTFDLMNWNLEFFGAQREDYPDEYGPADEPLQEQNVKTVILSQTPDLIAVQEVSNPDFFNLLVSQLPGYSSVCSPRYSHDFDDDGTFPPQKVCYIYDTTAVKIISHRPMFGQLFDAARNGNPSLLPGIPGGDPSSFWSSGRLPFLLVADVTVNGVKERISFINIHAKSGGTSTSDYNRRAYDVRVLKDSLDAYHASEKFVILGDWNDDMDESILPGLPTPYASIVNDTARYSPITKALSDADARSTVSFQDVIDHQVLSNELDEEYLDGSVHILTPFSLVPNYATTTSDHLPVLSRYKFIVPVVSFATAGASITEGDSIDLVINFSRPFSSDVHVIVNGSDDTTIDLPVSAGSTSAVVTIGTADNDVDESEKAVTYTLAVSNAYEVGAISQFNLTIIDNDLPAISFAASELSFAEGSGKQKVFLTLSSPIATPQSVTISLSNSHGLYYGFLLDYTTDPAPRSNGRFTINIPANKTEVFFEINPNKDLFREDEETVTFSIQSVSNDINIGDNSTVAVHIVDVAPCLPVFIVYPNPTSGPISIWTPAYNEDSIVNATLFDPNGSVISTLNGTVQQIGDTFTDAMHGRRRGIYTIKLIQCDQAFTYKIMKR
jgi:hypothetical protein